MKLIYAKHFDISHALLPGSHFAYGLQRGSPVVLTSPEGLKARSVLHGKVWEVTSGRFVRRLGNLVRPLPRPLGPCFMGQQ